MVQTGKRRKAKSGNPFPKKPQEEEKHPAEWNHDLNPERMAGQNYRGAPVGNDPRARTAADIKALSGKLTEFTHDQLAEIPILPAGTKLKQGAVYLDLREPAPAPLTATAEMVAEETNYYTPKAEVPYEHWNRLVKLLSPAQPANTASQTPENKPFSPERGEQEAAVEKTRPREAAGEEPEDEAVDEAAADSFPASDPPSWTTGREKKSAPS
jgi:hypothetical protein